MIKESIKENINDTQNLEELKNQNDLLLNEKINLKNNYDKILNENNELKNKNFNLIQENDSLNHNLT